jgi:hypothetical protein
MESDRSAKKIFKVLGFVCLAFLVGCGGGAGHPNQTPSTPSDPPEVIVVNVLPKTASVQVGFTTQFTATVQNDPLNKGVTWSVSPSPDANCMGTGCGTIDAMGKYTAPSTVHDAPGLFIIATSVADPSKTSTAVVFVTPSPSSIAVSPAVVTVQSNGVQQFIATGAPFETMPVVNWSVSGSGCNGASCGTIDSSGMYTAPATAPTPPTVTVAATSVADSSTSGSATVRLGSNPDNAKLNGRYAFLLGGYDGDGNLAMAGSFVADGNGNISGGIADLNFSNAISLAADLTFNGTYSISSDNRASMTITMIGVHEFTSGFSQTFSFALESFNAGVAGRGRIIELDDTDIWATGVLAEQDPTAFSTGAITGGYAFGFTGTASSGWPMTAVGRFNANRGSLSAGRTDVYGLGLTESGSGTVSAGLDLPFVGVYEVSTNGRGTAALTFTGQDPGFSRFSFYIVSTSELLFIEVDTCGVDVKCTFKGGLSGDALQQSGGPFTAGSLNGPAVFNMTAAGSGTGIGGSVAVGQEIFDGSGNVTGTKDENRAGVVSSDAFNATYSIDTDGLGRGVLTIAGDQHPKSFYLVSPGKGFILDEGSYEAGIFEPQSGQPFSPASLFGDYVLGTLPWNYNWTFSPQSGVMTADGASSMKGTYDGRSGSDLSVAGNYSLTSNGRTTMTITPTAMSPSKWVFYLISPSKAEGIQVDAGVTNSAIQIIEK